MISRYFDKNYIRWEVQERSGRHPIRVTYKGDHLYTGQISYRGVTPSDYKLNDVMLYVILRTFSHKFADVIYVNWFN